MGAPLWGRCLLGCLYGVSLLGAPYECVPMGVSLRGSLWGMPLLGGVPVGRPCVGAAWGGCHWCISVGVPILGGVSMGKPYLGCPYGGVPIGA